MSVICWISIWIHYKTNIYDHSRSFTDIHVLNLLIIPVKKNGLRRQAKQ